YHNVPAIMWLLVRAKYLTVDIFDCPSYTIARPDSSASVTGQSNFTEWNESGAAPGSRVFEKGIVSLCYSIQVPYPMPAAVQQGFVWDTTLGPEFALAADMNPGLTSLSRLNPPVATVGNGEVTYND